MLGPLPALTAYRADLARHAKASGLASCDGKWIIVACAVEQFLLFDSNARSSVARNLASVLSSASRSEETSAERTQKSIRDLAEKLRRGASWDDKSAFDGIVRVAEDMESAGALHLAFTTLAHLRVAFRRVDDRRLYSTLTTLGRISRALGDLDSAVVLYSEARRSADEVDDHSIRALASHGLGGVALAKGNLPDARKHYEEALRYSTVAALPESEGRAHRGLLIVAAKEQNFDAALRHGWAAFQLEAGDTDSRAELIGNLAGLCRECGYYDASLAGYAVAVQGAKSYRIRIPALGGAVLAAAMAQNATLVVSLGRHILKEVDKGAPPFETAQVLVDLALALEMIGELKAKEVAARSMIISSAHHFFELEFQARAIVERFSVPRTTRERVPPIELTEAATAVVASMTALAGSAGTLRALVGTTE